jgi:hypothetical protein
MTSNDVMSFFLGVVVVTIFIKIYKPQCVVVDDENI